MKTDTQKRYRRSFRLKGYDYSLPGAYFITLVAHHRECLFREVVNGEMRINQFGEIVQRVWVDLPQHYPQALPGEIVVMPNHVHGIMELHEIAINYGRGGSQTRPYGSEGFTSETKIPRYGLPEIVRAFKSFSAWQMNHLHTTHGLAVWQRSYYDPIIRSEQDLIYIWKYIRANPQKWAEYQFR